MGEMGDFVRTVAGVLAASTVCCSAAGTGSPPLPTAYAAPIDVPDPAPAAPADPLPPGPDFNAIAAPAPPGKATTFYSLDAASHLVRFTSEAPWKLDTHTVTGLAIGERLAGQNFAIDPVTGRSRTSTRRSRTATPRCSPRSSPVSSRRRTRTACSSIDATHDVLARLVHPANGSLDTVGALDTLDLDRGSATRLASIGTTALHALAIER